MRRYAKNKKLNIALLTSALLMATLLLALLVPIDNSMVYSQGTIVSTAPYVVRGMSTHYNSDLLMCYARQGNDKYLVHYSISLESIIDWLQYNSYFTHSGIEWPYISYDGRYMYVCTSDPSHPGAFHDPGWITRYDVSSLSAPSPAGQYYNQFMAYAISILRDPTKIIMQTGAADDWRDTLAYFPSGQVIGEYDDKRGFSAIAEKPGGGFVALAPRRKYLDEQPAEEPPEMIDRDARTIPRSGPDLIELSPTLQYVRTIGLVNKFMGMYGMSESDNVQLELANNGLWAVIGWPGLSTGKMSDEEKFHWPTHPHGKWFNGLAVIDIASGNVIRHWYPNGGGLDGKVNWFDITADGMKVIAKSGAEEWDAMGEPITNGYVYIFNLATGQVVKQDWGLEDGSDIEIVDSVNRVYCTLPSQQALVWFPMP